MADPSSYLRALADSAGTTPAALDRCLSSGSGKAAVESDLAAALRTGAHSTPTFYVEGALIEGDAPAQVFRQVLDSIYRVKSSAPGPAQR